MKKSIRITGIAIIIASAITIYLITRPKLLGNINNSYTQQTTNASNISFSKKAGERIKFSFTSDITNGELEISLFDSAGNEVYILAKATALETFFTFDRSDTYTLVAKCTNFIGEYKVKVYEAD